MKNTFQYIVLALAAVFFSVSNLFAKVDISSNGVYYIFHSSGMALSSVDGAPNLHTFNAGEAQQFRFVQSGSSYLIKSVQRNSNVAKTGQWNTEFSSSTGNAAKFTVEDCGGDYVRFRCADNNLCLGTDGTVPGASVYSDKNGRETLHLWYLREANGSSLITDGLYMTIEKAELFLSTTKGGDGEGEYPVRSQEKLLTEIDAAKSVYESPTSQAEVVSATTKLADALNAYKAERNSPVSAGVKYYIVHASNRYLSNENGNVQIKNRSNDTKRQFVFEAMSDGSYALKNVASGTYLTASGEYDVKMANSSSSSSAHVKVGYAPDEEYYVRLQFASNGLYLGTDGTSDGKGVYSDKSGSDGKHYWYLVRVDAPSGQPYHSFLIGSPAIRLGMDWLDAEGKHINAHGGCVLYEDGTYYWFGENYRPSPVRSNGIVCYTSKDLYNWKRECMAYECPEQPLRSDYQDMNYGRTLERPKVMKCPNTGKYVMWVHWENGSGYAASRVAILYADKITGPYKFVKTMRPRGDEQPSGSRDQTLMFDPDYNVGYHFGSAEENMTMHGTLLKDDYLDLSNTWERMFVDKQYEAPAIFKYHQRFVAITSGCTGWDPNPAHSSYSQLPLSGWADNGNPCVDANANKSYCSQSNYVFKVPGKYDAYIYMGDRWKGGDYFPDANVGESWHIWLPIDMRSGYPIIRFYGEWSLDLFDKLNRYRRVETFEPGKTYLLLSKNANRILSNKEGKLALTEDNDDINLSFRISAKDDYYILTDVASGKALDATDGGLSLRDSSGSHEQQWRIVSSGTHDGYYYFYPRSSSSSAMTNFSATPTLNGVVGLGTAGKTASCQFAFCFDSKKVHYAPISDESDGSYARWIESKGYRKVEPVGLPELYANEGLGDDLVVYTGKNQLSVYASRACDVYIYTLDGRLVRSFGVEADVVVDCQLPAGVYLVNGRKVRVE